jgi:hypothetical protein
MRVLVVLGNIRAFPKFQAPGAFFLLWSHTAAQVYLGRALWKEAILPPNSFLIHLFGDFTLSTVNCNHLESSSHFNGWKLRMRQPRMQYLKPTGSRLRITKYVQSQPVSNFKQLKYYSWISTSQVAHFNSDWTSPSRLVTWETFGDCGFSFRLGMLRAHTPSQDHLGFLGLIWRFLSKSAMALPNADSSILGSSISTMG